MITTTTDAAILQRRERIRNLVRHSHWLRAPVPVPLLCLAGAVLFLVVLVGAAIPSHG